MKFNKQKPFIFLAMIMLLLTLYNVITFKTEAVEVTENQLSNQMLMDLNDFEHWLMDYTNGVDLIKSQLNQLSLAELKYRSTQNKYLAYDFSKEFKHGTFIGFTDGYFTSNTDWLPPDQYDPRERPWYTSAIKKSKTTLSDVYVDLISYNFSITVSTPLYVQNRLVGVLGTDLYLENLNTKLLNERANDTIEPFILNQDGLILADASEPSHINQIATGNYSLFLEKAKINRGTQSEIVDGHILYVYYYSDHLNLLIGSKVDLDLYTHQLSFWIHPQTIVNLLFWILFMWVLYYIHRLNTQLIATSKTLEQKNSSLNIANVQLEEANNLLAFRAVHDGLTGLNNRFAFDDLLNELISKGFQERKHIGLILFDVDDFKAYNDIYGHVLGDEALALIAKEVLHFCDDALMVARYGGEEFAILYYDQDIDELDTIATNLLKHIQNLRIPHRLSDLGYLTISGGVNAILPGLTTSRGMFIHQADTALYQAKSNGKNQFVKAYSRF